MSFNPVLFLLFVIPSESSVLWVIERTKMGLAMRFIVLLFSVSLVFLLFNLGILEGGLHLAGRNREVDIAAVTTHGVGLNFVYRFRMLIGLNHHQSGRRRRHHISSAAPASAPAPSPVPIHEARSSAPAPLFHSHRKRMPSAHGRHIIPTRSAVHKLGDGGNTRLPKAAIIALAVVGAFLLVLGVAIAAFSLGRSMQVQNGCSKRFKMFLHGSKAQRPHSDIRKVSSHPSPDPLYLSSVVNFQENYSNFKQSSESKSLSIISTSPKSIELIISSHASKNHNSSESDEIESFHSVPCSPYSTGSITRLQIDKTMTEPCPSSAHTDNSPSDWSFRSCSPDYRSHLPPKSPIFTAPSHFHSSNISHSPPEESDTEKAEVNHQEIAKSNDSPGSMEHHEARKEEQVSLKFSNPPSDSNSPSNHMNTNASTTSLELTMSNTKVDFNSNSTDSSSSPSEGAKLEVSSSMSVPKSPLPPPPPKIPPPSLKGQSYRQPPQPPALPLQIKVDKDGYSLPRLKPLHWDKVRAAPSRSMVWNDISSSSFEFEFDEQTIKSLFSYNFHVLEKDQDPNSKTIPTTKHVIDHHRLQNTTILLKTLNAKTEQVCNSITQGTGLSVQQLEALVKMKPNKEEEEKLLNYDGNIDMLDPAENFVKVLLTIPMAFPRMEVMLYKETFDDEVAHIKMSFAVIEEACTELRSSKLFLRLLEAVLKTGNRMNIGTLRGGASAFKLGGLLKLADIRGADGKTTLLHFVVQEMGRSKGLKASEKNNQTTKSSHITPKEREEYWARGVEFVSQLSNELGNVNKVASIDLDSLVSSTSDLSCRLAQFKNLIGKDLPSNEETQNFVECMRSFLDYAENTTQELEVSKAQVLLHIKELTEYYHGEVGKDEPNLLHIFVIMKDFLGLLERVCREMRGSKYTQPLNQVLPFR